MVKDAGLKSALSCLSLRLLGTTVIGVRHRDALRIIRKLISGLAVYDCVSGSRINSKLDLIVLPQLYGMVIHFCHKFGLIHN